MSYSTLNVARSAVSRLLSFGNSSTIGEEALAKQFFKGVFRQRPPHPKYTHTWDVGPVLHYLRDLGPSEQLTIKQLSLKTVSLTALLTGQRCQTIHLLSLDHLHITPERLVITVPDIIKQSRPGFSNSVIVLPRFLEDTRLCVVNCLENYLFRTSVYRKNAERPQIFLSYVKPHLPVTRDTISRWVKSVLSAAGIDTSRFKAHSVRSASTSAAAAHGLPLGDILKTVGWSSQRTFDRFYRRHTLPSCDESCPSISFASAVRGGETSK